MDEGRAKRIKSSTQPYGPDAPDIQFFRIFSFLKNYSFLKITHFYKKKFFPEFLGFLQRNQRTNIHSIFFENILDGNILVKMTQLPQFFSSNFQTKYALNTNANTIFNEKFLKKCNF